MCTKSLLSCRTLCDPVDHSLSGSSAHGNSPGEFWSGLPFPSPADLPDPGIQPASLTSTAGTGTFLPLVPPGRPHTYIHVFPKHSLPLRFITG